MQMTNIFMALNYINMKKQLCKICQNFAGSAKFANDP